MSSQPPGGYRGQPPFQPPGPPAPMASVPFPSAATAAEAAKLAAEAPDPDRRGRCLRPRRCDRRRDVRAVTVNASQRLGADDNSAASRDTEVDRTQLTVGQLNFVNNCRGALQQKGMTSTASDSQITAIGGSLCQVLRDDVSERKLAASIPASTAANLKPLTRRQVIRMTAKDLCPQGKPATVTCVVTGAPAADVTSGPAGSACKGSVPMRVTRSLGSPSYFAIGAQLEGGGTVRCEILVKGKVISSRSASGGYDIAQGEIIQDPISGQWEDDNSGWPHPSPVLGPGNPPGCRAQRLPCRDAAARS